MTHRPHAPLHPTTYRPPSHPVLPSLLRTDPSSSPQAGSRVEPSGAVYAPLFMVNMPYNLTAGKRATACVPGDASFLADLGVHTNFSCLAAVDLGVSYGWYASHGRKWRAHFCLANIAG